MTGATVDGVELGDHDRISPCAASLPMGFAWSLYFCQRCVEARMASSQVLRNAQWLTDRGRAVVFKPGLSPDASSSFARYVYVDNLGVLGFGLALSLQELVMFGLGGEAPLV